MGDVAISGTDMRAMLKLYGAGRYLVLAGEVRLAGPPLVSELGFREWLRGKRRHRRAPTAAVL
jgi:hypothetical protein